MVQMQVPHRDAGPLWFFPHNRREMKMSIWLLVLHVPRRYLAMLPHHDTRILARGRARSFLG